jgi:phosphoglucomutase
MIVATAICTTAPTENLYKIYAESSRDERHLQMLVAEAQQIVTESLRSS